MLSKVGLKLITTAEIPCAKYTIRDFVLRLLYKKSREERQESVALCWTPAVWSHVIVKRNTNLHFMSISNSDIIIIQFISVNLFTENTSSIALWTIRGYYDKLFIELKLLHVISWTSFLFSQFLILVKSKIAKQWDANEIQICLKESFIYSCLLNYFDLEWMRDVNISDSETTVWIM